MPRAVCTFAVAHTDIASQPFNNAGRTVRVLAPNNLNGTHIRVKFSNHYAKRPVWVGNASIALCDETGALVAQTIRPLTVNHDTSFAIVPGHDIFSDWIALPVTAGSSIAVSLYYPLSDKVTSGNFVDSFAKRSVKGDFCAEPQMKKARILSDISRTVLPWDVTGATTTVSEILVKQPENLPAPRVIAAFGDSIMQQSAWTAPFTQRLYAQYPGEVSFCNLGIGGNRLLHNASKFNKGLYGKAGIHRFAHDVLRMEGLTHAILALGTNDLGLPGKEGVPEQELITLQQYVQAVEKQIAQLHKRHVKVYAALMLPREITPIYTLQREQLRLAINEWTRTCGLFDAVLDFEKELLQSDGTGMQKEYAMPDGLHINKTGGQKIADMIDLALF